MSTQVRVENVCLQFGQRACLFGDCVDGQCVCHDGYTHDVLFTRLENCAMPAWWPFFVHGLNLVIGFISLLYIFVYFRGLRGGARNTLLATVCILVSCSLLSVCYLAEGFAGRAFFLFHALTMMSIGVALGLFSETILRVALSTIKLDKNKSNKIMEGRLKSFRLAFWLNALLIPLPYFCALPAHFVLGDPKDPSYDVHSFNLVTVVPSPLMWCHNLIFFPTFVYMMRILIASIDETIADKLGSSEKLLEVRSRLWLFLFVSAGIMAPLEMAFMWIMPLMYLFKVPSNWLVFELSFGFINAVVLLFLVSLKRRPARQGHQSTTALSHPHTSTAGGTKSARMDDSKPALSQVTPTTETFAQSEEERT